MSSGLPAKGRARGTSEDTGRAMVVARRFRVGLELLCSSQEHRRRHERSNWTGGGEAEELVEWHDKGNRRSISAHAGWELPRRKLTYRGARSSVAVAYLAPCERAVVIDTAR